MSKNYVFMCSKMLLLTHIPLLQNLHLTTQYFDCVLNYSLHKQYYKEIMFSLESQIEPYTDASFSAEVEAQHFFKSYGEADISKKLQEMASIQQSIETVLRQKVRANYGMFLVANDEINQVDEEMSDLKHLISNTQKLIEVRYKY